MVSACASRYALPESGYRIPPSHRNRVFARGLATNDGTRAKRAHALLPALVCLLFFVAVPHLAAAPPSPVSWQTAITEHPGTPPRLIAVDKLRQQLYVFERHSPLRLSKIYACTTGQVMGDKRVQGDLKTPEGVYFVVQHINSGLDFTMYGKEAYTLNYPNPVDRLRRKTGYGIWIHGRGEGIYPLQTQGCVALNNKDLNKLGKLLSPGTPVALTSTFSYFLGNSTPPDAMQNTAAVRALEKKVRSWAKAWENRSDELFAFYDKDAYSIAQGEPFSNFQRQKERLFKSLPWIKTSVRDIQVLQGPGYWVTWFHQDYEAPNLSTNGVRRLYWEQTPKGDFRILGMEWAPGMTTGTLLASAEPALPPLEASPKSEEQAIPLPEARQQASANAIKPPVQQVAAAPAPVTKTAVPETSPASAQPVRRDHLEDPSQGKMPEPPQAAALLNAKKQLAAAASSSPADILASLPPALPSQGLATRGAPDADAQTEPTTLAAQSAAPAAPNTPEAPSPGTLPEAAAQSDPAMTVAAVSDKTLFRAPLPEMQYSINAPKTAANATESLTRKEGDPKLVDAQTADTKPADIKAADAKPVEMQTANAKPAEVKTVETKPAEVKPVDAKSALQVASAPAGQTGQQAAVPATPGQAPDATAARPAAQTATAPDAAGGQDNDPAASLTQVVAGVTAAVESWRADWEKGDLDAYISHYAPKAAQGERFGARAIRKHKQIVWEKMAPAKVTLSNLRISVDKGIVQADMDQEYADKNGGGDKGIKTLTFTNSNGKWLITKEIWTAAP